MAISVYIYGGCTKRFAIFFVANNLPTNHCRELKFGRKAAYLLFKTIAKYQLAGSIFRSDITKEFRDGSFSFFRHFELKSAMLFWREGPGGSSIADNSLLFCTYKLVQFKSVFNNYFIRGGNLSFKNVCSTFQAKFEN
jgi:hypothetical protein